VAQGLGYYMRLANRYPNVRSLADSSEDELLKLWQGLGYYSRARNLHAAAKQIVTLHKGVFPDQYQQIRALKGVGDYTAAAVSSFAFDLPHAVVDGNVFRFLSRFFNEATPIDTGTGKKLFAQYSAMLLDPKRPAIFNQAIMEFGSQFCKSSQPDCPDCVFTDRCAAFKAGTVKDRPVKSKKTIQRDRSFSYRITIDKKGRVRLNKRAGDDIWKGLYEFPLTEIPAVPEAGHAEVAEPGEELLYRSPVYQHSLSHQKLKAVFYVLRSGKVFRKRNDSVLCDVRDLGRHAFPRLIEKFMEDCDLSEIV
jgi:A/G-specific adenine glycosylase